ncbi:MAG: DUF3372 domain-containing protein, partial [Acidobacteriaceae bacterium]|nr:DUF3372 domain-containing protein [Acidobacteriaceae bacterium]
NGGAYGAYKHILVVFNATDSPVTFTDGRLRGLHLHLHPVQQGSKNPVTRQSTFSSQAGSTTVPALTTAVFVGEVE